MTPVEFEPTISAGERPQTYALDRAATGTGIENFTVIIFNIITIDFLAFVICNMSHIQQMHGITTITCGNGTNHAHFQGFSLFLYTPNRHT
jgi:hypothetical protein